MTSTRYTNAKRLELAIANDAALVAARAEYTEARFREELSDNIVGDEVILTSGPVAIADFFPAWRRGEVLNSHRAIIERGGALR